jgi:hypothetical protein
VLPKAFDEGERFSVIGTFKQAAGDSAEVELIGAGGGHRPQVFYCRRLAGLDLRPFRVGGRFDFFPVCSLVAGSVQLDAPVPMVEAGPPGVAVRIDVSEGDGDAGEGGALILPALLVSAVGDQSFAGREEQEFFVRCHVIRVFKISK